MSLASDVVSTLTTAQIVPDVLSEPFTPTVIFTVIYPTGVQTDLGNTVVRSNVLEEPNISITPLNPILGVGEEKETRYTLVMVDPDAPSRAEPKYREWRHWVVRLPHFFIFLLRGSLIFFTSDYGAPDPKGSVHLRSGGVCPQA
jgi:hypothetical protein